MSPPAARSSSISSCRRTRLTVRRPRSFAKAITERPTPELPAFWITQSPGLSWTYSLSSSAPVGGLIPSMDNCCGSAPCGSGKRSVAGKTILSRQEEWEDGRSTRSPTLRWLTSSPTERIRPTPSLPRPAGKEGNTPYWPLIVRSSEELIGAYSTATSTSLAMGASGSGIVTCSTTSDGSPNVEISRASIIFLLCEFNSAGHGPLRQIMRTVLPGRREPSLLLLSNTGIYPYWTENVSCSSLAGGKATSSASPVGPARVHLRLLPGPFAIRDRRKKQLPVPSRWSASHANNKIIL